MANDVQITPEKSILTREDLHALYNLAETSGSNRKAFEKLIGLVRKHGEVSLEVEY